MKYLEDWRRICEDGEERHGAAREEMVTPDDGLACAEERLAAKRAAELEERAKVIERLLPVVAAQLGIMWNEVTGSGRPMPSEIQLTSTGTGMTAEEHGSPRRPICGTQRDTCSHQRSTWLTRMST
jgi:hypothetical protein